MHLVEGPRQHGSGLDVSYYPYSTFGKKLMDQRRTHSQDTPLTPSDVHQIAPI